MVTGDNLQTAKAIALECGILTDPNVSEPVVIEGRTFRACTDAEREAIANEISVRVQCPLFLCKLEIFESISNI